MECPYCNGTGISNICVNGTFKTCSYCNGTGEIFKCPMCGEFAFLSNWGSLVDHDYADYHVECENCGFCSIGNTDPQKAKEMFLKGLGSFNKTFTMPLTNGERVRNCSSNDLAQFLYDIVFFDDWRNKIMNRSIVNKTEIIEEIKNWLEEFPHVDKKESVNEL